MQAYDSRICSLFSALDSCLLKGEGGSNLAKSHRNQVNLDARAMGGQPQVRSSASPYLLPQKAFVERTEMVLLKKELETHFSRQLTL